MSGLPGGEPAGVTLESDVLPQDFPPGDVRRLPEAPGHLYLAQSPAPTSDQRQVPDEDPPFNFEFEAGDGDAPLHSAPGGSQTVRSVTTGSAVGGSASTYIIDNQFGKSELLSKANFAERRCAFHMKLTCNISYNMPTR
jgi:hypothetical protein